MPASRFRRVFPPDALASEDSDPFVRPREVVDDDEAEIIEALRARFDRDARGHRQHAGKDDPSFHEPHWGHTTGLLRGTLAIDAIEALPEAFRVGLFAANASYPAIVRANFVFDPAAKLALARFGVKLSYPTPVPNVYAAAGEAHELDLLLAEGDPEVNGANHTFFVRDAREFAMLMALAPPSAAGAKVLLDPRNWSVLGKVLKALLRGTAVTRRPPATTTGWAGKTYFSIGPYRLGEGAMKFCFRPRQKHPIEPLRIGAGDPARPHHEALRTWIAAGQDAVFDLCVQIATPACLPEPGPGDPAKAVMAAEYCDLPWDEVVAPYVKVGTLTLPASPASDLSDEHPWSPLQLNAWNTLSEMRPLGQLFRARKHVHKTHSDARVEHLYGETPGGMVDKAPFAPGA